MSSDARHGFRGAGLRVVMLSVSLLSVELLAGMQRYLSQTVLPLMATELNGRHLYGVVDAAAQAPMFLTMPIGAWLLSRFSIDRLFLSLTMVTVIGSVVCALAPSMPFFIGGTAIRALAAGALATVGMGAISRGLPPRYRQLVLAGMSGVWVISSVLGPVYAVAVSSVLGWRWAIVLYLPLLVLARMMIARSMPERSERDASGEKAPWTWAVVLALGSVVLSLPVGVWGPATVVAGGALMLWATRALLPTGTLASGRGRRAGLSALLVTAAAYFGASMVLSVVAHDAFGLAAGEFGVIIAAPGFMWAVAALWCGAHPAAAEQFGRRVVPAGVLLAVGVAVLLTTTLVSGSETSAFVGLVAGAALLGLGMGALYPDLLGRCLTQPDRDDGISQDAMAGAVVLSESVGMALATTAAFTWLGAGLGLADDALLRAQVLYAALLVVALAAVSRLVAASRPG